MRYYFLGIAGTAMASLAVLLKQKGHQVWGSDLGIYPPMSEYLKQHDIEVLQGYDVEHLKRPFDQAVIGNAMSRGNPEVEAILNKQLPFISMPEVIRDEFVRNHKTIVITGTHGKTTTTALMSWILQVAGKSPGFLIGGISRNFDASVAIGEGRYFVIEGDEYDSAFFDKRPKFLHYFPHYLIINNLEFDHADIYADLQTIEREFRKLIRIMPSEGLLAANAMSPAVCRVVDPVYSRLSFYGAGSSHEIGYQLLSTGKDGLHFGLYEDGKPAGQFLFPFPGEFQLHNVAAVVTVARDIGLSWDQIREGLASFRGVKRRLEYWGTYCGADVFDDFAHHPTAIEVTLNAMRQKYPRRRLVALFEPRTNTTVRNFFQDELARALSVADVSVITPIHRAEKIPVHERLSMESLTAQIEANGKQVLLPKSFGELPELLPATLHQDDVFILLTNGGLGGFYEKLRSEISPD